MSINLWSFINEQQRYMKLVTNKFKLANNLFPIFFLSNVDLLLVSYLNVNVAEHATFNTQFNSVQMK